MGNDVSVKSPGNDEDKKQKPVYADFFSSAGKTIGQASGVVCGSLSDTFEEADLTDITSQPKSKKFHNHTFKDPEDDASLQSNPMSHLFARALLNEVTDNPSTMTPMQMAEREKRLLKAQQRANHASKEGLRAIGGQGTFKQHIQGASQRIIPPSILSEHRAQVLGNGDSSDVPLGKYCVTIGLMLSRRDPVVGHPNTITRQCAYDFNDLQDRNYKYVSSTDAHGWRAGGGESGEPTIPNDKNNNNISTSMSEEDEFDKYSPSKLKSTQAPKVPAPDNVHIPIIHINCESEAAVNAVVAALARGEVFIPHMSIMPEALGVNGISPPDLVVRFGCERSDDFPPEEWPNWCLEFMHNQLYEYFSDMGACWMKRPFQTTLAKKVRWKTVKHMNKFFAHSETVINSWREMGPRYLDPQLTHIDGGATPEEVARPHGIYLLRNGKPTNYFAPNFEPPYTTKMTRSLLSNVISKSWDKKRRDWSTGPVSNVTPSLLFSTICGCAEPNEGGFIAREATNHFSPIGGGGTFFSDHKYDHDLAFNINSKDNRTLLEGMKIARDDSGITRSQIDSSKTKRYDPSESKKLNDSSTSRDMLKPMTTTTTTTTYVSENAQEHRNSMSQTGSNVAVDKSVDLDNSDDEDIVRNRMQPSSYEEANYASPQTKQRNNFAHYEADDFPHYEADKFAHYETPLINNRVGHNDQYKPHSRMHRETSHSKPSNEPLPSNFRDEMRGQSNIHPKEGTINHSAAVSVGESQTTVPIMNRSSAFIESERERRKQRELEREKERKKIDELEMAIQEKLRLQEDRKKKLTSVEGSPVYETEQVSGLKKKNKKDKKDKKDKKKRDKKDRKEKDRSRSSSVQSRSTSNSGEKWGQSPMLGVQTERSTPYSSFKENRENRKLDSDPKESNSPSGISDSSYFPMNLQNTASSQKRNQNIFAPQSPVVGNGTINNIMDINSTPSMDYSMDTASLLGDGSLIGGQFAGDSSVFTMGTSASDNKSLLSCVTRSTVHDMSGGRKKKGFPASQIIDDDASQSLIASTSNGGGSHEPIPSDDDLFAIGWAKALDPKSGCYYYFTLDRSKTVWENPLITQDM